MSKQIEQLSKDLALGVSRRKAFLRFGAGLGAMVLGLMTRKTAHAEGIGDYCNQLCKSNDNLGFKNHGACVSFCVHNFRFNVG